MAEAVAAGAGVAATVIQAKAILLQPLKQTIASSNDMDEIYGELGRVMETLIARRNDHEDMAHKRKTTMMSSNTYTDWNTRVDVVAKEVDELKVRYTKENKRSPWFSINARSNFTKKMKKTAFRVVTLIEEDNHLVDVLVDKKPACVMEMITSQITNIPTLQQPLEETLDLLCNKEVSDIKIYGLVGSGKRIIMQNLNNHIKVAEMFDIVIWVSVSRKGSMKHRDINQIQQDIIERLKLDIGVTSNVDLIANRIRAELTNIKYLLLLDDVNEDLDLDKIGVPKRENGSKIVITTRLQRVCSSIATIQINVEKLKPKEALELFKSELNRPLLEENPNIKKLMPKIVRWCGHLPLMIKVVAGVFRVKETEPSWQDGLRNLSKWPYKGDNTMQEIYMLLKCCFDCLEDTQKTCLFYSALYPEDSDIQKDCLLYNWAAEELFDTTDEMEETLVTGREILDNLMKVSLLMENASQQCIGMHKLIRLAALFTLSINNKQENLVQSGESLEKPMDVECWRNKRWISLVDSKMNAIPDQPNCQTLSTLFLQKNPNLVDIPQEFFKYMQGLRVLNLYDTGITSLPQSFFNLVALKVLCLQECVALVELPLDAINFQNLEVLDVRGSGLAHIPPQVKNLNCLKRLLISFTRLSSSSHIQEATNDIEVISKIPMLRELVIDVKEGEAIVLYELIVEVFKLTSLSLLQFCFPKKVVNLIQAMGGNWKINFPAEILLTKYISKADSLELKKCQIFFGCDISSHPHIMKFMPYFKFDGKVSNDTISQVLGNDVAIELVNHNELEHLSNFTPANMSKIHTCVIKDCNKMKTLVDSNMGGTLIFSNLEQLHLINLPVLKNIFEGSLLVDMPNLKKLMLVDMPQLTSILVSNSFKWHSLEKLKILRCPQLKRLPFQKDGAMKLKSIEAEESWWETLENDGEVKEKFRHYCIWR